MRSVTNPVRATILVLLLSACSLPTTSEVNLAFRIDRNQLVMSSVLLDGHAGRYVLGTASPRSVVSADFAESRSIDGADGVRIRLRPDLVTRVRADLGHLGEEIDAIIGRDLISPVVVIDYRNQLVTRLSHAPELEIEPHRWRNVPQYPVTINGKVHSGIIDTAIPDSLIIPRAMLPGTNCRRCVVDVEIAGVSYENLDVRVAEEGSLRIGNRILERFMVVIDYRRDRAALIR